MCARAHACTCTLPAGRPMLSTYYYCLYSNQFHIWKRTCKYLCQGSSDYLYSSYPFRHISLSNITYYIKLSKRTQSTKYFYTDTYISALIIMQIKTRRKSHEHCKQNNYSQIDRIVYLPFCGTITLIQLLTNDKYPQSVNDKLFPFQIWQYLLGDSVQLSHIKHLPYGVRFSSLYFGCWHHSVLGCARMENEE